MAAPHLEFYSTDVPSAGTQVQIANTPRKVLKVWVKPKEGNSGISFFGSSAVSATTSGISMPATTGPLIPIDLGKHPVEQSTFWVDVASSADNVETIFLLE
jgi:hypothetical protein